MPNHRALLLITVELFATVLLWWLSPVFTAIVALVLLTPVMRAAYGRAFPKGPGGPSRLTVPADAANQSA